MTKTSKYALMVALLAGVGFSAVERASAVTNLNPAIAKKVQAKKFVPNIQLSPQGQKKLVPIKKASTGSSKLIKNKLTGIPGNGVVTKGPIGIGKGKLPIGGLTPVQPPVQPPTQPSDPMAGAADNQGKGNFDWMQLLQQVKDMMPNGQNGKGEDESNGQEQSLVSQEHEGSHAPRRARFKQASEAAEQGEQAEQANAAKQAENWVIEGRKGPYRGRTDDGLGWTVMEDWGYNSNTQMRYHHAVVLFDNGAMRVTKTHSHNGNTWTETTNTPAPAASPANQGMVAAQEKATPTTAPRPEETATASIAQ